MLPVPIRSLFVPTIQRAYAITQNLFEDHDFLRWAVAEDVYRMVRRIVVEYEFQRLVNSKNLGLEAVVALNAKKNYRHLELRTTGLVLTISQTERIDLVPRDAVYRNQKSLSNQCSLIFPGYNDEDASYYEDIPLYGIIVHGYFGKQPDHVGIGIPEPYVKAWITQVDLLKEMHGITAPEDVEVVEPADMIRVRQQIQEVVEGGKK